MISPNDLKPHQRAILQLDYNGYVIVDGGVGTFKTTACTFLLFRYLAENPGARVMVLMQTQKQLLSVFWQTWQAVVPGNLYSKLKGDDEDGYELWNGSRLLLHYADNPAAFERIRGTNLSGYYISQGELVRRDDLSFELDQRVRMLGFPHLRMVDCNGGIPGRVAYRRFIDADNDEFVAEKPVHRELSAGVHLYRAKRYNRIHVETNEQTSVYTAETLAEWRRTYPEAIYRRLVLGAWTAAQGVVFPEWSRHVHTAEFEPDPSWEIFRGIDFGYTNPFVCLWIGIDYDKRLWVFDEYYKSGDIIPHHASEILSRWTDLEITATYADPSGPWRELQNALDQTVSRGYNDVRYGITRLQRALLPGPDGKPRLTVHATRCPNLQREMETYEYKPANAIGQKSEEPLKLNDHAIDALRYTKASEDRRNGE